MVAIRGRKIQYGGVSQQHVDVNPTFLTVCVCTFVCVRVCVCVCVKQDRGQTRGIRESRSLTFEEDLCATAEGSVYEEFCSI